MLRRFLICFLSPVLFIPSLVQAEPSAVSPGSSLDVSRTSSTCPTFSWTADSADTAVELFLWDVSESRERGEREALLKRRFVAGATSWTPSLDDCLEAGRTYGWGVRSLTGGAIEVPTVLLFEVLEPAPGVGRTGETERGRTRVGTEVDRRPLDRRGAAVGQSEARARPQPGTVTGGSIAKASISSKALSGQNAATSGVAVGTFGGTDSPDGAGLAGENLAGGVDLLLISSTAGQPDAGLSESGLVRDGAGAVAFDFSNPTGSMTVRVDGVDVVTSATDQDALGALSCTNGQVAKSNGGGWACGNDDTGATTVVAGNQLSFDGSTLHVVEGPTSGLDADTVDGVHVSGLAPFDHDHTGQVWTTNLLQALSIETSSAGGQALIARSTDSVSTGGAGVKGEAAGPDGRGVVGSATSATGFSAGVEGLAASENGAGVTGFASSASGSPAGVHGTAVSAAGVGVRAEHTSGGYPLELVAATSTFLSPAGIYVDVPGSSDFHIDNLDGTVSLKVGGQNVVTTATDQDTLGSLACSSGQVAVKDAVGWTCGSGGGGGVAAGNQLSLVDGTMHVVEGAGSGLDADTLDGFSAENFSLNVHDHAGQTWSTNLTQAFSVQTDAIGGGALLARSTSLFGLSGYAVKGEFYSAEGGAAVAGNALYPAGPAVGVQGFTASAEGIGVVAHNEGGGTDLLLEGTVPARITESSFVRDSAGAVEFDFVNPTGTFTLKVEGSPIVTSASDQDTLGGLACSVGQVAKRQADATWACATDADTDTLGSLVCTTGQVAKRLGNGTWACGVDTDTDTTYSAGNEILISGHQISVDEGPGSGLDADTLDGFDSSTFSTYLHGHYGQSWSGSATSAGLTVHNSAEIEGLIGILGSAREEDYGIGVQGNGYRGVQGRGSYRWFF